MASHWKPLPVDDHPPGQKFRVLLLYFVHELVELHGVRTVDAVGQFVAHGSHHVLVRKYPRVIPRIAQTEVDPVDLTSPPEGRHVVPPDVGGGHPALPPRSAVRSRGVVEPVPAAAHLAHAQDVPPPPASEGEEFRPNPIEKGGGRVGGGEARDGGGRHGALLVASSSPSSSVAIRAAAPSRRQRSESIPALPSYSSSGPTELVTPTPISPLFILVVARGSPQV
mmetsp:Transcript_37305/g.111734  ORF Transcript_37305/g.111734 Transcript_37305/m.111734 type:complete len:224 (+) Transcript_37305:1608-2279(+)